MPEMARLLKAVEELTGTTPPESFEIGGRVLRAVGGGGVPGRRPEESEADFVRRVLGMLNVPVVGGSR